MSAVHNIVRWWSVGEERLAMCGVRLCDLTHVNYVLNPVVFSPIRLRGK